MVVDSIVIRYGLDGPVCEIQLEAKFSAPVQVGNVVHPASCRMGTGFFLWGKETRVWCLPSTPI